MLLGPRLGALVAGERLLQVDLVHHVATQQQEFFLVARGTGEAGPLDVLSVQIEEVFLHCAKSFMRSKLWDMEAQVDPKDFPTMGQMLKDQLQGTEEPESREDMRKRYQKDL